MTRKYASCVTREGKKPWNLKHETVWNIAVSRDRGTTRFIYAWFNAWRIRSYNELSFTRLLCSTRAERDHFSIRSRNQKWLPCPRIPIRPGLVRWLWYSTLRLSITVKYPSSAVWQPYNVSRYVPDINDMMYRGEKRERTSDRY